MSTEIPDRPEPILDDLLIAIVASEYNRFYVDGLVDFAMKELSEIAPSGRVEIVRVPGSFEIPLGVQTVIDARAPAAVLAFGLLFDGLTTHANLIAESATQALMSIGLQRQVPVLHEIIVAKTEDQARERCLEPRLNRGSEAARAAIRMVRVVSRFRRP